MKRNFQFTRENLCLGTFFALLSFFARTVSSEEKCYKNLFIRAFPNASGIFRVDYLCSSSDKLSQKVILQSLNYHCAAQLTPSGGQSDFYELVYTTASGLFRLWELTDDARNSGPLQECLIQVIKRIDKDIKQQNGILLYSIIAIIILGAACSFMMYYYSSTPPQTVSDHSDVNLYMNRQQLELSSLQPTIVEIQPIECGDIIFDNRANVP